MMTLTAEVDQAVAELREAHPSATVTAVADGKGGAWVTLDPVDLGDRYAPRSTWLTFQITFQYPLSDVYPLFIRPDVRRVADPPADGTPLGQGTAYVFLAAGSNDQPQQAIQLSRRSNRLNPATDTAALKVAKVLAWIRTL